MVNDVTPNLLRRLAAEGRTRSGGAVLSLFLDLDPSQLPTPPAREAAVDSLLHDARRVVEDRQLEHLHRVRMREALQALEKQLRPSEGMKAEGARGMAAFVHVDGETDIRLLRLPAPVRTHVVLDDAPHVEPLVGMASADRWCVALVNKSVARFYLGDEHGFEQTGELDDDVHGQHSKGGWSQRRYEESIEQEVLHHVDRTIAALETAHAKRGLFDRLLLAGPKELRGAIEDRMDGPLKERMCGWVDLDLSAAGAGEVQAAAAGAIQRCRHQHVDDVLERLQAGIGTEGGHGVHGLETVLDALQERRVATLIVHQGSRSTGGRCPSCGMLRVDPAGRCPADGSQLTPVEDVVEAAVGAAYEQDAEVLLVDEEPRVQTLGGVAALTRF